MNLLSTSTPNRSFLISLATMTALIIFSSQDAAAHHCRFMKPDARNLCLAKNENARFYCSYIQDADQQRYCLAYVDRAPGQCTSITDEALKTQCDAEAQARLDEQKAMQEAADAAKAAADAEAAQQAGEPSQQRTP